MVQYTLAQSPEVLIDVSGRDSNKAREKAMDQLMTLMEDGKLPTELDDGFNPKDFIEVKDQQTEPSDEEKCSSRGGANAQQLIQAQGKGSRLSPRRR